MNISEQPLVTVILTVFNQEQYLEETLNSVFYQTYPFIQLIVVDNASTDGSFQVVERIRLKAPAFQVIRNTCNVGLCRAFNQALEIAHGKYVIDLSGDDILLPDRVEMQVNCFQALSEDYAVVFSNAKYIDHTGRELNNHYPVDQRGRSLTAVPSGDIYKKILEKYFICTPTMMMRKDALVALGGYDENLLFEDFDFWVRSAVKFRYHYQDEILTKKRVVPASLSTQVYQKKSGMLASYYVVCNKAYDLNRDQQEFDILADRIRTFIRKCLYAQEFELALRFRKLLNYIENPGWQTELVVLLCRLHLPVNFAYRFYIKNLKKAFRQEGFSF